LLADHLAQPNRARIRDRDHDLSIGVQDAKDVKVLARASDVFLLDADDLGHPLRGIDSFVPNLELDLGTSLHSVSLR
jgi:hypothetical protein